MLELDLRTTPLQALNWIHLAPLRLCAQHVLENKSSYACVSDKSVHVPASDKSVQCLVDFRSKQQTRLIVFFEDVKNC